MQEVGIKGLQVDDLYSLDPSTLASLQPIHALIFLFKWVSPEPEGSTNDQAMKKSGGEIVGEEEAAACGVYFATQVINNACATIATVNAVSNMVILDIGCDVN
jgi:ubiquitin carboxyl-terminal hydrolase L5